MSFLDDIAKYAPTIGGVLGGVGGELVDPFGGGVVGAGLGSALGKGFENYDQGKGFTSGSDLTSDLGAGAEGAIGQGVGDLAGGAIGAVGSTLGKYGAGVAEKDATGKAAQDIVDEWKPVQNTPEFKTNFGKSQAITNEAGLKPTAENFKTIGDAGTGDNGLFNTKLDNIVKDKGDVDFTNVPAAVEKAIQDHAGGYVNSAGSDAVRSAVMDDIAPGTGKTYVDAINAGIGVNGALGKDTGLTVGQQILGKNLNEIDANSALKTLRQVRKLRDAAANTGGEQGMTNYKIYNDIFNNIRSSIYDRPEIDAAVAESKLTPEEEEAVAGSTNGNQKAADYLKNKWNNATASSEINQSQADLVNMRDLGNKALTEASNRGQLTDAEKTAQESLQGEPKIPLSKEAVIAHVAKKGMKASGPISSKVGGLLERISPFTSTKGVLDETQPMLHTGILNKIPGALGTTVATSPNVAQGATMNGTPNLNTQSLTGATGAPTAVQSPYQTILGMIQQNPFLAPSLSGNLNTLEQTQQQAQTAEAQLPALQASFAAAGGAQGPLGGLLAKIGSAFGGGETAKYTAQQKQLMQLLQSLGISPANVPSITESPQAAQAGMGQIQSGLTGILGSVPGQ